MNIAVEEENKVAVRLAVQQDEEPLMDLLRRMHPEMAMRQPSGEPIPMDEGLVRSMVHRAILPNRNRIDSWIGVIGNGELYASVHLSIETPWYSHWPIMQDNWLYVAPEHRRTHFADALIDFAKKAADAARIQLNLGHMSPGREAAKARLYRRHFGNPIGNLFTYQGASEHMEAN